MLPLRTFLLALLVALLWTGEAQAIDVPPKYADAQPDAPRPFKLGYRAKRDSRHKNRLHMLELTVVDIHRGDLVSYTCECVGGWAGGSLRAVATGSRHVFRTPHLVADQRSTATIAVHGRNFMMRREYRIIPKRATLKLIHQECLDNNDYVPCSYLAVPGPWVTVSTCSGNQIGAYAYYSGGGPADATVFVNFMLEWYDRHVWWHMKPATDFQELGAGDVAFWAGSSWTFNPQAAGHSFRVIAHFELRRNGVTVDTLDRFSSPGHSVPQGSSNPPGYSSSICTYDP